MAELPFETRTLEQLVPLTSLSPDALTAVQEPGGPVGRVSIKQLLGRLVQTDTAKETRADLLAELDHDEPAVGLVFADPDPAKNGWYRKTGASGTGTWTQFEKLSAFAAAEIAEYVATASDAAEAAELAATAAQALTNFRKTIAEGVADFGVGDFFSSAEGGEIRLYERIAGAPFYDDLGDDAAPLTKSSLASSDVGKGASLALTTRGNSVERELTWARAAAPVSINEFHDAANGAGAERIALEGALATGRDVQWLGDIVLDQPITMPVGSGLRGFGFSSEDSVNGKSRIVRGFAGTDPMIIALRECRLIDIDVDGQFSGTGDNIQVKGGRCILRCSSRHAGRDGIWFGATDEAINANLCVLEYYLGIDNARYGMRIEHTDAAGAGGSYPLGGSNASGGYAAFLDLRKNGAAGLYTRSAIDWTFAGVRIQENYDEAWVVEEYTRGFEMLTPYIELNNMVNNPNRQVHFRTNSEDNILGVNRVLDSPKYLDEGSRNYWRRRHPQIDGPAFNRRVNVESDDPARPPTMDFYAVDLSLAARFGGVSTGVGSQGKAMVWAKPDGNVPIQIMEWVNTVGANLITGDYYRGGVKVLGAQQAAILDAAGGTEVATINAILAALRAHGIIDT